jgi:hypothetical protein
MSTIAMQRSLVLRLCYNGNFLLIRPYHGEHGPKVPVTPEYIALQHVPCKNGSICQS